MLKRHLKTSYNMTPDEYRTKWGLSRDYPMVAPVYAAHRSTLAKKIGLGRKPAAGAAEPAAQRFPARRARGSRS
jgi:predicted transcriptional regulator